MALNAWTLERETEPAQADGGVVLHLRGGDLHVREDGDRAKPALLLLHGLPASMRWWDAVVPRLAREHRVIRVDLLGQGGSEKPRDGYGIERQADLVAQALERLGVSEAAVVGHSYGGFVGTALVERHAAALVSRLMTIGTPPDLDSVESPMRRLATAPVVGPLVRRLVPDRLVHAAVERTFMPEFDVPERLSDDVERTTYRSFSRAARAGVDFREERSLDDRLARAGIPLLIVTGERDSLVEPDSVERFRDVPGARIVRIPGVGHSPQVEAPGRTAELILDFTG